MRVVIKKTKIQNVLYKQYWQNINQIRLVGGGSSNYAVVKDETGNSDSWYAQRPNCVLRVSHISEA